MTEFDGKVLFATGAGGGIAGATAKAFTDRGGRVAVLDHRLDAAEKVAAELPGALPLQADVTDEDAVRAAVAAAAEHFGRIDCVLNAAGHAQFGPIESWSWADWNRMMSVHVGGMFLVCRETLPHLRAAGAGAIVNIASIAAFKAQPQNTPYGTAKGAIVAFTRQLAIEVAPAVRVTAVAPGRIRTGMTEPLMIARGDGDYAKGYAVSAAMAPLNRVAEPTEIADLVCFLLSPRTPFMTGTTVHFDGGESAT